MQSKTKKHVFLGLLVVFLFLFGSFSPVFASTMEEPPTTTANPNGTAGAKNDIHIFYTSDMHCGMDENITLSGLKALVNEAKREHPYVSLVDLGDNIQGGTFGSLTKGELVVDLMNRTGFDVVTIGNHEFDYGMEQLANLMAKHKAKVVASNVKYSGNQTNIFANIPEYVIEQYGDVKVGFLGILTPEAITSSTPKFFMEDDEFVYNFYSGNNGKDLYEKVQSTVDELHKEGADYVIALSHLGSNPNSAPFDSVSLIANTEGIDVVLDGHSHSTIIGDPYPNKSGKDVILSSVGTKLQNIGELIIGEDGKISTLLISECNNEDPSMVLALEEAEAKINDILSEKVTNLDFDMNIVDEEGVRITRSRETTVGDFMADAYRSIMEADIGMINGGGVRSSLPAGEITYKELFNIAPFQNDLASCSATGQQVLDALEFGAQSCDSIYKLDGEAVGESGAFMQVSGLKYTIDTSVPTPVKTDENGMLIGFEGERRVKDVLVEENGKYVPLDPAKKYTVASINYILYNNGDGNTAFEGAERVVETGPVDVEALRTYLEENNGFSPDYKEPQGRITIE